MLVKRATREDINQIIAIIEYYELIAIDNRFDIPVNKDYMFEMFYNVIERDECALFLHEHGLIFGMVSSVPWSSTPIVIDQLFFVKPEYRSTGLASYLAKAYEEWAKGKGAKFCTLSTASGLDTEIVCKYFKLRGYSKLADQYFKEL